MEIIIQIISTVIITIFENVINKSIENAFVKKSYCKDHFEKSQNVTQDNNIKIDETIIQYRPSDRALSSYMSVMIYRPSFFVTSMRHR